MDSIKNKSFYLIGIKGTGMTALAELLNSMGARVSGADVEEVFYTDQVLQEAGIPYFRGFQANQPLLEPQDYYIRSSAYSDDHVEVAACLKQGKTIYNYTQALGALSACYDASGISGIHGKTTTTALAGTLMKELQMDASVLIGSAAANFGNRSVWCGGNRFFVAETCEYQRHFLDFHPRRIILTSLEEDHLDYFKDLEDIHQAFADYIDKLPQGGELIFCIDDPGAAEAARRARKKRPDLKMTPYGHHAEGPFQIVEVSMNKGENRFRLAGWDCDFSLPVPGEHLQLNAAAALALTASLLEETGDSLDQHLDRLKKAFAGFQGTRRRSEIIGESGGVLVMDDYGHHPHAIDLTLKGYKSFYSDRRLVVSFMSHTYTRTSALLEDFARCFEAADCLILHDIYSSAREKFDGTLTGEDFYHKVEKHHPMVHYFPSIEEAEPFLKDFLKPGDLFLTLGAGNNWPLGRKVLEQRGSSL